MNTKDIEHIHNLLNEARESISGFCINECGALCCKKGSLVLFNNNEINFICQNNKDKLIKNKVLIKKENSHHYNLEKVKCPHLTKNNLCDSWKDKNRPKICSDFPLFLTQNKFVITGGFCPAIKKNLLKDYLKKLEDLGLIII